MKLLKLSVTPHKMEYTSYDLTLMRLKKQVIMGDKRASLMASADKSPWYVAQEISIMLPLC